MLRQSRLEIVSLESRDTPAGAITATVSAGALTIIGDDHANKFTLERHGSYVLITGHDTLVNGSAESVRLESVVNSIKATTYGGGDEITIPNALDFVLPGAAWFDLGDGNNKLLMTTAGELSLGTLFVKGGDGFDTTMIEGAPGSQIGTSAIFQLGDGGSSTGLKNLDMPGAGQVNVAASEGGDTLTLDNCEAKFVVFSGGYGQGSVNIKNSTVGPVTLNGSQGPAGVAIVNTTVNGAVKATGPEGIQVSLDTSTINGDVTAKGGLTDLDSKVGVSVANTVTVNGNLNVSGYQTTMSLNSSTLTVSKNIIGYGTDTLTIHGPEASVSAKELELNSPRSISMIQNGTNGKLALSGALSVTGRIVDLDYRTLNVAKAVNVNGTAQANLKAGQGTMSQYVNTVSSVGSAALSLGGYGPLSVVGNVYVSAKLSANVGVAGTLEQNLTVNGGFKNDTFGLGSGTYKKNIVLNLKDGANVVGIGNFQAPTLPNILGNLTINTKNGNDLIGFLCNVTGTTTLNTGGGADTVWVYSSTFGGTANFNLGGGDDILQMHDAPFFTMPTSFNAKATIDLGAGNDTLILGLVPGDPNNGGGDANSLVAFATGLGSSIKGGTGINFFDDELSQSTGLVAASFSNWTDPT